MPKHNLHISDIVIDGESWPALIFYTVDKGLKITEIIVNQKVIEVDDVTKVRLKKECQNDYFDSQALDSAVHSRKNPD